MENKYRILVMVCVLLLICMIHAQFGRDVKACSSSNMSFGNTSDVHVSLVANKIYIFDKEEFAQEMLERCMKNNFKEIRFSYDVNGYPTELHIEVYLNEYTWKKRKACFEIRYIQQKDGKYNLKDNPEKFDIEIIKI